jgi:SPP1 family predicted phage head-tail adaptor
VQANRLSERIVILRKLAGRDPATGAETVTWPADPPEWAEALQMRGRELVEFQQSEAKAEVRFTIHYKVGITSDARVVWRGKTYELTDPPIDVGSRRRYLELMARSIAE